MIRLLYYNNILIYCYYNIIITILLVVKNPLASAGDERDLGSIPGWGTSPGGRHGNPLQCSCLENPMDRGAWWVTINEITKSWTGLSNPEHARRVLGSMGENED